MKTMFSKKWIEVTALWSIADFSDGSLLFAVKFTTALLLDFESQTSIFWLQVIFNTNQPHYYN